VTRGHVHAALGSDAPAMPAALIRVALESPAEIAVVPMQDLLGLGSAARMNIPGTMDGNWAWRFHWPDVPADFVDRWRALLAAAGRLPAKESPLS
jgi:4-alpha-glucanotransferase